MFDISKLSEDAIQVILNAAAILNEESVKVEEEAKPEPEVIVPIMTAQEFTDLMATDNNYYDIILNKVRPDMTDEYPEFYKGAVLLSKWVENPTRAVVSVDEDVWRKCITRINRLAAQVDNWISGCGFDRNQLDSFTTLNIKNIEDDEKVIYNRFDNVIVSCEDRDRHIWNEVYAKLTAIIDSVSEIIYDDEFEIRFAGTPAYAEVQTIGRMIASVLGVSSIHNVTLCRQKITELCNGFATEFSVYTNPAYITITALGDRAKAIFDLETNAENEEKFEAADACYFDDMYEAADVIEERTEEPEGEIRFPDQCTANETSDDASETDDYGDDEVASEVQTTANPEAPSPENEVVATQVIPVAEAEEVEEPSAPAGGSSVTNAQMDELILRTCQSYLKTVSKIVSQGKAGDTEQLIVVSCMRSYCSSKNIQAISSYYPTFAAVYNQIAAIVNAGYIPATFDELVTALK